MHENIYSSAIDGEGGVSQGRKKKKKSKAKHGHVFFFFLQLRWNVAQNKIIVTLNEQIGYSENQARMLLQLQLQLLGVCLNCKLGVSGREKRGVGAEGQGSSMEYTDSFFLFLTRFPTF